jgi:hypothetical protein
MDFLSKQPIMPTTFESEASNDALPKYGSNLLAALDVRGILTKNCKGLYGN